MRGRRIGVPEPGLRISKDRNRACELLCDLRVPLRPWLRLLDGLLADLAMTNYACRTDCGAFNNEAIDLDLDETYPFVRIRAADLLPGQGLGHRRADGSC